MYPDHVVFLPSGTFLIKDSKDIDKILNNIKSNHKRPILLIQNHGVLVPKDISEVSEEMVLALSDIIARIPGGRDICYLTKSEEDELLNWDAEKYRLRISKK